MVDYLDTKIGAKLPLYAFEKENSIDGEKALAVQERKEPPVEFLDSLLLGEVTSFDLALRGK